MGLLRWLRGGDDNAAGTAAMSAGLAEIDGLFRPSRHKQTEHVESMKRRRIDISNGKGVDLDNNTIVVKGKVKPDQPAPAEAPEELTPVMTAPEPDQPRAGQP